MVRCVSGMRSGKKKTSRWQPAWIAIARGKPRSPAISVTTRSSPASLLRFQLGFENRFKHTHLERSIVALPIDEDRRGTGDGQLLSVGDVLVDDGFEFSRFQVRLKAGHVETDGFGHFGDLTGRKLAGVGE